VKPLAIACLLAASLAAQPFLFTSFRGNGESGVYFALSEDGYRWAPLNGGEPVIRPQFAGMLMRDPFLVRGPDGRWHMLWTTGWTRSKDDGSLTISLASSSGLIHWSWQKRVRAPLEGARNARAPEAVWRPKQKQ
jgi:sucrose-6-phosphate hydrolase SacC (GH32 family)